MSKIKAILDDILATMDDIMSEYDRVPSLAVFFDDLAAEYGRQTIESAANEIAEYHDELLDRQDFQLAIWAEITAVLTAAKAKGQANSLDEIMEHLRGRFTFDELFPHMEGITEFI